MSTLTPVLGQEQKRSVVPGPQRAAMARCRRAVNYLAAAQVYLRSNPLLENPLRPAHLKNGLFGQCGTGPDVNLVCAHLNRLATAKDANVLLIRGTTHYAAARRAIFYLDGSLEEFGQLEHLVESFEPGGPGSRPHDDPAPAVLAAAFAAAGGNPDLLVACLMACHDAETLSRVASWSGARLADSAPCGYVVPMFTIDDNTAAGGLTDEALASCFDNSEWHPIILTYGNHLESELATSLERCYQRRPAIVFRSLQGRRIPAPRSSRPAGEASLEALSRWLRSYRPGELFGVDGRPADDILRQINHFPFPGPESP